MATLEQRLDNTIVSADVDTLPMTLPDTESMSDKQEPQDEPVMVAGPTTRVIKAGAKRLKPSDVLEPLTQPGARAVKEPAIVASPPIAPAPTVKVPAVSTETITFPQTRPADISEVNKVAAERQRLLDEGGVWGKPPETPISSDWTDSDGLAATIRAAGENAAKQDSSMSLRSIYTRAINAGVPESFLARAIAGESMDVTVGGSSLAKQLAGAVLVHDESAKKLDELFTMLKNNSLDDNGKLDLRMRLAQHDIIVKQLKGMQTDVARSLNVFKRVQDAGPGLDTKTVRQALDELGIRQSDSVLFQLANDYLDVKTQAGRNRLLEVGIGAKMRDVWFYTYQSNLLNDPQTHAYNIVGSSVFGAMAPVERTLAIPIGMARQLLPGASPDRYHFQDIMAGMSGLKNGILDGWELAVDAIKKGAIVTGKQIGRAHV